MRLEYFDMIDTVSRFEAKEQRLTAHATVPMESPVFEGHFPGHPLVPGVLLTETMAQASGYLILALNQLSLMPFLMTVDKARFRTFVEPGAKLDITATLDVEGSGYAATKAAITIEGKAICDAQLRFRIMPFPADMQSLMLARASAIGLTADKLATGRTP
ncbi:MAG: 3-hydroxyacyl-ACP dehydratase FabZ family protein [Bosea sp. (in: a-proteobacteria)]